jgi:ribonuclease-3
MRTIKLGKIGPSPVLKKSKSNLSEHEIAKNAWDDYSPVGKNSKKKEYTKGAGDRMLPAMQVKKTNKKDDLIEIDPDAPLPQVRSDLESIEDRISYKFKNRDLLKMALTHRSALGVKERADYERLEFLGDAVLDLAVAHLLSDHHVDAREGELSKMRAALVNTQSLAQIAKNLELHQFIKLGRGEHSSGGAERPSILADVTEAVIGAVYRDSSYEVSLSMIEKIFGDSLKDVTPFDPKTELQELLHAAGSEPPSYLLELIEGPEHAPTFVTVVLVDGQIVGRGRGATKKSAQQEAAAQALIRMVYDTPEIELKKEQKFFIESALLFSSESEQKKLSTLRKFLSSEEDVSKEEILSVAL